MAEPVHGLPRFGGDVGQVAAAAEQCHVAGCVQGIEHV
jgi:hypothetical protein